MSMNIELNDVKSQWQDIKEAALPEIENYLESGKYVDSPYVTRFEEAWSWYTFKKHSVMVSNGTDAVTLCLQSLPIFPDTTCVILPNNTWASVLWMVKKWTDEYELLDCNEYLQLDLKKLETWLHYFRSQYKHLVVFATHILGHMCDMVTLRNLADKYNFFIIEDCSQAHGASMSDGRNITRAGQLSDIAFWSCYPGKNLGSSGQAGIISSDNKMYIDKIRYLINCGMYKKNSFFYESGNDRPDAIGSIVLFHKLKLLNTWNWKRRKLANHYFNHIKHKSVLPKVHHLMAIHAWHYFYIIPDKDISPILEVPHTRNYPFTLSSLAMQTEFSSLSVSEKIAKTIICLPCHPYLSEQDVKYISSQIDSTLNKI